MVATDDDRRRIVQSQNGDHGAFEAMIRDHLPVAGGYLWAQFDKHLHKAPLAVTR